MTAAAAVASPITKYEVTQSSINRHLTLNVPRRSWITQRDNKVDFGSVKQWINSVTCYCPNYASPC